ncbi:hypothetical protein MD484_g8473, partial [Candolleomyces efflorescens]
MKFFSYIFTALAVSLLPVLTAAGDHKARNHHQGLSRRAEGHLLDKRQSDHSRWSWYDTQTGNAGSCGRMLRNSEFVVAMNVPQYRAGNCFKFITLSWRGKTTRAQIVDMCPGCPYGGLDLSPSLFQFFTGLGTGIISDGTWWFEGDGPAPPPPPPTTTRTTSRWTPPPTPTSTTTRRTTTRTSTTPRPTSTSTSSTPSSTSTSTTSSSSSSSTVSQTSTSAEATSTARLSADAGNLANLNGLAASFGQLVVQGAAQ